MNVFDSHLHIINPRYPLVANQGYTPPPFTVTDYFNATKSLNVKGGVVVAGSFQGNDHSYLTAALKTLNRDRKAYFGVINFNAAITGREVDLLHETGIRGMRVNLKRLGGLDPKTIKTRALKCHEQYQWHTGFYIDSRELPGWFDLIASLPKASIDHLGLSKAGLEYVYKLVEAGVKIKATGFGRLDFDPLPVMKRIHDIDQTALMFGTDLPSTRALRPFRKSDIKLVTDHFSQQAARRILFENGWAFYGR